MVYNWYRRYRAKKQLMKIWEQTAYDPLMSEARRQHAIAKYVAEGGRDRKLRKMNEKQMSRNTRVSRNTRAIHSVRERTNRLWKGLKRNDVLGKSFSWDP